MIRFILYRLRFLRYSSTLQKKKLPSPSQSLVRSHHLPLHQTDISPKPPITDVSRTPSRPERSRGVKAAAEGWRDQLSGVECECERLLAP